MVNILKILHVYPHYSAGNLVEPFPQCTWYNYILIYQGLKIFTNSWRQRQRDRDRETERQRQRQRETETERKRERASEREIERERGRERERERETKTSSKLTKMVESQASAPFRSNEGIIPWKISYFLIKLSTQLFVVYVTCGHGKICIRVL